MREIASLVSLMASAKGLYVPLLGSGVSRGAGIPTGHEVMCDLIRKLAKLEGATIDASEAEAWYVRSEGQRPTYTSLLERLGHTPAERTALLRGYFEPTEAEREQKLKLPTKGHRALASLAAGGFIRVILTTNFDHLIEMALREANVEPLVVYSSEQVSGMPPLTQVPVCVVKLHGDYMDLRTMNTADELATYDDSRNKLLDRVFDEYGLIVCGWSAQYDTALRASIERCPSRRYSMFWALRGGASDEAKALIALRGARLIPILDADAFLHELSEGVLALSSDAGSDVVSRQVAVARLKRYLPDPMRRIDLEELVAGEAERCGRAIADVAPDYVRPDLSPASVAARVLHYEQIVEALAAMLFMGGYWGGESDPALWVEAIQRLVGPNEPAAGSERWIQLADYPGLVAFYACGVGAVTGSRVGTVTRLLTGGHVWSGYKSGPFVLRLHQWFLSDAGHWLSDLPNLKQKKVPVSERVCELTARSASDVRVTKKRYEAAFDEWELLVAMSYAHETERRFQSGFISPMGRFSYRHRALGEESVVTRFERTLEADGDDWQYLRAGLFDGRAERAKTILVELKKQPEMLRPY